MSEQSANSQGSVEYGWQSSPVTASPVSIGTTGTRKTEIYACPECGERVHSQTGACPACGENLGRTPKQIRCMHCSTPASSELVICPGCGRELREAPPKLMKVGAPALLALLLLVLIASQWERVSPIGWVRANLGRGVTLVGGLSASIEPEVVIVMTPIAGDNAGNPAVAAAPVTSNEPVVVALVAAEPTITPVVAEDAPASDAATLASVPTEESPVGVGGPQLTKAAAIAVVEEQTLAVGPTVAPTETPAATSTLGGTPVPPTTVPTEEGESARTGGLAATVGSSEESPSRTPTPTWTIQPVNTPTRGASATTATSTSGATGALALLPATASSTPSAEAVGGVAQVAVLSANETLSQAESRQVQSTEAASSTPTLTPTQTPAVVTSPSPTPTVTPVVYQVQSGDTLVTIAARYNVTVEALMAVNAITAQEVFVLQPGQMLFVPVEVPTPSPVIEPTATVVTIPVAIPIATAASSPLSTTVEIRLEAPELVLPVDEANIGCTTGGTLVWQRLKFVKDSDKYVLHLGFVNGQSVEGQENVTWILAQAGPVTETEWSLDTSLCDLAPAEFDHQWRWWVEVAQDVEGRLEPVSPPSPIRGFTWN